MTRKRNKRIMFALLLLGLLLLAFLSGQNALAVSEDEVQAQVEASGKGTVAGNVLIWFLCAVAFLKVSQKIDSFMASIGVNVGHTGGSMLSDVLIVSSQGSRPLPRRWFRWLTVRRRHRHRDSGQLFPGRFGRHGRQSSQSQRRENRNGEQNNHQHGTVRQGAGGGVFRHSQRYGRPRFRICRKARSTRSEWNRRHRTARCARYAEQHDIKYSDNEYGDGKHVFA